MSKSAWKLADTFRGSLIETTCLKWMEIGLDCTSWQGSQAGPRPRSFSCKVNRKSLEREPYFRHRLGHLSTSNGGRVKEGWRSCVCVCGAGGSVSWEKSWFLSLRDLFHTLLLGNATGWTPSRRAWEKSRGGDQTWDIPDFQLSHYQSPKTHKHTRGRRFTSNLGETSTAH